MCFGQVIPPFLMLAINPLERGESGEKERGSEEQREMERGESGEKEREGGTEGVGDGKYRKIQYGRNETGRENGREKESGSQK